MSIVTSHRRSPTVNSGESLSELVERHKRAHGIQICPPKQKSKRGVVVVRTETPPGTYHWQR
jgi:hypothetical protein